MTSDNYEFELSCLKFLNTTNSNSLYLCATSTTGNVIFFTKPESAAEMNPKNANNGDYY